MGRALQGERLCPQTCPVARPGLQGSCASGLTGLRWHASATGFWRLQATAAGLKMLAQELTSGGGAAAAQLRVAEQYVEVSGLFFECCAQLVHAGDSSSGCVSAPCFLV